MATHFQYTLHQVDVFPYDSFAANNNRIQAYDIIADSKDAVTTEAFTIIPLTNVSAGKK